MSTKPREQPDVTPCMHLSEVASVGALVFRVLLGSLEGCISVDGEMWMSANKVKQLYTPHLTEAERGESGETF